MFQSEAILGVVNKTISANKVFGELLTSDEKTFLVKNCLVRPAQVGEVLCHEGQIDDTLYLIVKGEAQVSKVFEATTLMGKIGPGELIGEIAVLYRIPRIANVVISKPSVVLEIPAVVFIDMMRNNPALQQAVVKHSKNRILETSLRSVPVFRFLDAVSFGELLQLSSIVKAKKGTVIAHEGQVERSMYVVCSGTARVYINSSGKEINVALIKPGDYFGEYSLFTGKKRSASVAALTDLQLVELKGESIHNFMEYNEDAEYQISVDSSKRQSELADMRDSAMARRAAETRLNQVQDMLDSIV